MIVARSGRPIRALALFLIALGTGLATRLPALRDDLLLTHALLAAVDDTPAPAPAPAPAPVPALILAPLTPTTLAPTTSAPLPVPIAPAAPPPPAPAITPIDPPPPSPPPEPSLPLAPPAPPLPTSPPDLATTAYARLAAGDRGAAAALLAAALAASPADPRRAQWQADRAALTRRWSGEAYALLRRDSPADPGTTASPILGGSQLGATLAFTPDPLARRPLAAFARVNAALPGGRLDRRSTQAAIGARFKPHPAVTIAAERLIALGPDAIDDWSLRIAAGHAITRGRLALSGYAEANLLGSGDAFAGAQARATLRAATLGPLTLAAGVGTWASIQSTNTRIGRIDAGPTLVARTTIGGTTLEIAADWRFRIAGTAAPDSGPALTVSAGF